MKWDDFNGELTWEPNRYVLTNIECPKCNELLRRDTSEMFTTFPPKHRYVCWDCKFEGVK